MTAFPVDAVARVGEGSHAPFPTILQQSPPSLAHRGYLQGSVGGQKFPFMTSKGEA
jgi:hypothetical protein